MSRFIDVHFHLDFYKNHKVLYNSINQLGQYTLCMTNSPGVYLSCKNLYSETKYLKFALGFHPLESGLKEKDFADFLLLANSANYIGEVGLDFSKVPSISRERQLRYFESIVEVCAKKNKLLSVHLRKSEDDAIKIIGRYQPRKCIIHWFNGTNQQLNKLIDLGCFFSINSNMIKTKVSCDKLKNIPVDRLLIESDGPFTKIGTKSFVPKLLPDTYEAIANTMLIPNLIELVYGNFKNILTM